MTERCVGIVEVRQGVPIGPPYPAGGCSNRACLVNGAQKVYPAISNGKPLTGVQSHLVPDPDPICSTVHVGTTTTMNNSRSNRGHRSRNYLLTFP